MWSDTRSRWVKRYGCSLRQCADMFPGAVGTARLSDLATGHEDVLGAVVVERLASESAIESFQTQARDVQEPQPFVLGCPPERTGSTIVQGDVDSVITNVSRSGSLVE